MQERITLIIGLYLAFSLFEMLYAAEKKHTLSNKLMNIFWAIVLVTSGAVLVGFIYRMLPFRPRHLEDRGIAVSIAIAFLYAFINDFIFYWYHRAQHHFKSFWVIHELHHSDTELNVTTSMRTYWLERPLQTLLITLPITFLIGVDTRAFKIFVVMLTIWLFFTHANLKLRLGFLTRIVGGPQLHRIHHSNLPEHQGKNFAQFFPVLDIIFGTYYHPGYNEFPTTGLVEKNKVDSIPDVMARPFETWFSFLKKRNDIKNH